MEHSNKQALVQLSNATLASLPKSVLRPKYNRASLRAGIVHIGVGNFHRAHQARYLHQLMQMNEATDWAVIGAGVQPSDARMRDKLLTQDCLTTLIELNSADQVVEVIGPMIDFLPVDKNNAALIVGMSDPSIRIVTLTITEGGYCIDSKSGGFDIHHADIVHDANNPANPRTAFGVIVAALKNRRSGGLPPFTCLSCDNLQRNGDVLRQAIVGLAQLNDPGLADWIQTNTTFPNSVVDCIVPATGNKELELVRRCGIDDRAPVTHENFRQWVMEDKFCAGRPNWDKVGVIFKKSVHDYETMKLRILNAGHQVIANAGELLSLPTIADCMAHPLVSSLFTKVESEEVALHVNPVPEITLQQYIELIRQRFSEPSIVDTTRRVAFDGSSRHPSFVLPIVRDALRVGTSIKGLALVEALWARMCSGTREDGSLIKPNDPLWDSLVIASKQSRSEPRIWIEQKKIYGDLSNQKLFVEVFEYWLNLIWADGTESAIATYIGLSQNS